jgi:spermidine synthase
MDLRKTRILKSFTLSINDILFSIQHDKLTIIKDDTVITTSIKQEELGMLEAFCIKAKDVVQPLPGNNVVYSIKGENQDVVLLRDGKDTYTLIINDQIQFITDIDTIYHEALVSPAVACLTDIKDVLILGGGDGLVAKQLFKELDNVNVTLVDFDKNITDIFTYDPVMREFNENSMDKCSVINDDAYTFVQSCINMYDVIICDFPDPDDVIFNKLYSLEFYTNVKKLLKPNGAMSVQCGSISKESKCFLSIKKTLEACGFKTKPYYSSCNFAELTFCLATLEGNPNPVFKNKYETLDQYFFDNAMTIFRPKVKFNSEVEINTKENMAAYNYRKEELE